MLIVGLLTFGGLLIANSLTEPQRLAPGVISTDGFQLGVTFSPDGKTIYFAEIGEGFRTSIIMLSHFEDGRWSDPEPVSFAGPFRDIDAFVSPDVKKLFFQSDRPVEGTEA